MSDVNVSAPLNPHEIDEPTRQVLNEILAQITMRAAIEGHGRDFLLRVYLAGFYHGQKQQLERGRRTTTDEDAP